MARAALWAGAVPATEWTSAIATPDRPRAAARAIYSSGCEAPVRKVKFEVIDSSAQAMARHRGVARARGRGAGDI